MATKKKLNLHKLNLVWLYDVKKISKLLNYRPEKHGSFVSPHHSPYSPNSQIISKTIKEESIHTFSQNGSLRSDRY